MAGNIINLIYSYAQQNPSANTTPSPKTPYTPESINPQKKDAPNI